MTYVFDAASIAAGGQQVPYPTGTITSASLLIDVEGTADLTNMPSTAICRCVADDGKGDVEERLQEGRLEDVHDPKFKNQGQCVKFLVHGRNAAKKTA